MNHIKIFSLIFTFIFILSSCTKDKDLESKNDLQFMESQESTDILLRVDNQNTDNDYEKVIVTPLEKIDNCKYIVSGRIEYHQDNVVVAYIDYGDGICDNIAMVMRDGITSEISLDKEDRGNKKEYNKIIVEPLVKTETCDYITSGIIEYYLIDTDTWVATIDYGDGTCDEWATKTWDVNLFPEYPSGSETFSLKR